MLAIARMFNEQSYQTNERVQRVKTSSANHVWTRRWIEQRSVTQIDAHFGAQTKKSRN